MSRKTLYVLAITLGFATGVAAQEPTPPAAQQQAEGPQLFTVEELDNLLAPVALYPDPILAQLLVAATYPDQIALAARYVRTYGQQGIDNQPWDVSVKAIAHYPPVLNMLEERPDWATALGQAYAIQEGDVMASVQGLRKMAQAQGNLVSSNEQRVDYDDGAIRIVPANPRVIYVPTYDPEIVYYRPIYYARAYTPYWSFGISFPIGVWLTYDFDWGNRVVYYHGWDGYGHHHSWYHDSRPFISFNTIYVNNWRTVVVVNRRVVGRHINYGGFDRYNWVHRRTSWDRRDLPGRYDGDRWNAPDGRRGGGFTSTQTPHTQPPRNTRPSTAPAATPRTARPRDESRRVYPVRVGSTNAPLYPRGDNGAETTPAAPRRERGTDNGSWNARPTPERTQVTRAPASRPTYTPQSRPSYTPQGTPTYTPRSAPRTADRSVTRAPRAPQGYSPSSAPRASSPRPSAPSRSSTVSRAPRSSGGSSAKPAPSRERSAPARTESRGGKRKN